MAHGLTLKLREIQPSYRFISSQEWKDGYCWKGICNPRTYRGARRRQWMETRRAWKKQRRKSQQENINGSQANSHSLENPPFYR